MQLHSSLMKSTFLVNLCVWTLWACITFLTKLKHRNKNVKHIKHLTTQSAPMARAIFSEDLGMASFAICIILCMIRAKEKKKRKK